MALLVEASPHSGQINEAVAAILRDEQPARRAAAAYVLGRKGTREQRDAVRQLLTEKDLLTRYRAAQGLLAGRDKAAVPALISLVEEAPDSLAWQAEDVLYFLAGPNGPTALPGPDVDRTTRRKCRAAWDVWWQENEAKLDLSLYATAKGVNARTLGIEYNTGRVWECGRGKTLHWEIKGLRGPMDAQRLPNDLVLIVESINRRVSVRDFKGNVNWEKKLDAEPTGCQRMPNGNTFVTTANGVLEFNANGEQVYAVTLNGNTNAVRKAANGNIVYTKIHAGMIEVDFTGKHVRRIAVSSGDYTDIQDLPGDRFLLAEPGSDIDSGSVVTGKVVEVDAAGKVKWDAYVPGACCAVRLPNGHTLVGANKRVVELNDKGDIVWEMKTEGYVRRVHSGIN